MLGSSLAIGPNIALAANRHKNGSAWLSALGQKRLAADVCDMSALLANADIEVAFRNSFYGFATEQRWLHHRATSKCRATKLSLGGSLMKPIGRQRTNTGPQEA